MAGKSGQVDKVESFTTTYKWKIRQFNRELEPIPEYDLNIIPNTIIRHSLRRKLWSESFMAGENLGIKSLWHVEIEDNSGKRNVDGELKEFAELKVTLIFENCTGIGTRIDKMTTFFCHARLSLLHPRGGVLIYRFAPDVRVIDVQTSGEKAEFKISHRDILEAALEDTVCISVELEIFGNDYSAGMTANLQRDFERLLMDQDSFDFIIDCDGKIFKAHKLILGARSTVFAAMLNNKDFKECQTNTLVVEDIDKTTMEILLHYIYTGKLLTELMEDSNVLESVIHGADKYDLPDLKNHCLHQLVQSITVENFGPMVILAFAVNAETNEKVILKDYYLRNVLSLMKNPDFRKLAFQHPEVVFED